MGAERKNQADSSTSKQDKVANHQQEIETPDLQQEGVLSFFSGLDFKGDAPPIPPNPKQVLHLQRTIGNRATQNLIQRKPINVHQRVSSGQSMISRAPNLKDIPSKDIRKKVIALLEESMTLKTATLASQKTNKIEENVKASEENIKKIIELVAKLEQQQSENTQGKTHNVAAAALPVVKEISDQIFANHRAMVEHQTQINTVPDEMKGQKEEQGTENTGNEDLLDVDVISSSVLTGGQGFSGGSNIHDMATLEDSKEPGGKSGKAFLEAAKEVKSQTDGGFKLVKFLPALSKVLMYLPAKFVMVAKKGYDIYKSNERLDNFKIAAKAAKEQSNNSDSDGSILESAMYAVNKVARAVMGAIVDFVISLGQVIVRIITLLSGGVSAFVTEAIDLSLGLIKAGKVLTQKAKGFYKWIRGKRGANRNLNAKKVYDAAIQGDHPALMLLVNLGVYKAAQEDFGNTPIWSGVKKKWNDAKKGLKGFGKKLHIVGDDPNKPLNPKQMLDFLNSLNEEETKRVIDAIAKAMKSTA